MLQTIFTHDWQLSDFDFTLPEELIAASPARPRDHARLLHVRGNQIGDRYVYDLPDLLRDGDILVMNDTKVVPARLYGLRDAVKVEILLNKPEQNHDGNVWSVLARPGKRLKVGQTVQITDDFSCEILEKRDGGEILIRFDRDMEALFVKLDEVGHIPLPPYIQRPEGDTAEDKSDYQTIYAKNEGAVAAPTAGLHFTPDLFDKLDSKGITRETVTLHVGAGTFLPVKTERVSDHKMHAEWGEITPALAERLNKARQEGRRIISVGTTSLRLLESCVDGSGIFHPFTGETDIFITPGHKIKSVDAMMTNFHLPKSTLFMLVCALAGMDNMKSAYAHAIKEQYRFYSYGDSSLLEKEL